MNIEKLAQLSGVSIGTVSKAFSNSKEISEKTREKIFAIARDTDCFYKFDKKGTAKKVIAVICNEIESEYYARAVTAIQKRLAKNNAVALIAMADFSAEKQASLITYFSAKNKADGIIVFDSFSPIKFNPELPIVAIGGSGKSEVDVVRSDNDQAINDAIKLLKNNGHKKIAFIGEKLTVGRRQKFIRFMTENGLKVHPEFDVVDETERFQTAGYNSMNKLYALKEKPTAIIAAYDQIALGAIRAIRDHGDSVPENFSIIGFNDIPIASYYNIALTTIRDNLVEVCDTAVDIILKKTNDKYFNARQKVFLTSELVVRNTVKHV